MKTVSRAHRILSILIMSVAWLLLHPSPSPASTVSVSVAVNDNGSVVATASGTFATCTTTNNGSVTLYRDGVSISTSSGNGSATASSTIDRATLNGTHVFSATATDCQGSSSDSYTLTLDNSPTAVSVTAPADGSVLSAPFNITGTATFKPTLSSTKGTISLFVDGGNYANKTCITEVCGFDYNELTKRLYDSDSAPNVKHTAYIVATSAGGVSVTSPVISFSMDKTPTAVSVTSPADGSVLSAPFNITGTATFKPTLSSTKGTISLFVDGGNYANKTCITEVCDFDYNALTHRLYDSDTAPNVKHTAYIVAMSAGGIKVTSPTISFSMDKTPTAVSVTAPADGSVLSAPFNITGTATFKPTLSSTKGTISLFVDGGNYSNKNCDTEVCDFDYNALTHRLYDSDTAPGVIHKIKIVATSIGGVAVTSPEVSFSMDKRPAISITTPPANSTVNGTVNVSGSVNFKPYNGVYSGTITFYHDNVFYKTQSCGADVQDCSFNYQVDLGHGSHVLKVVASNTRGSSSEERTFTVDNTPVIGITSPASSQLTSKDVTLAGNVTFKPTLSAVKGTFTVYLNGALIYTSGNCSTEDCAFSLNRTLDGGDYTLKVVATGGGASATAEKAFNVKACDLKITSFAGNPSTFDIIAGETTAFNGAITESTGQAVSWTIAMAGMEFKGSGNTASATWDGKTALGKYVEPGSYEFTLSARTADGQCVASAKATVTVTAEPQSCTLEVTTGSSANVASGNLYHDQPLFTIADSRMPIDFTLSYNSLDGYNGVLGIGWTHSYNITVSENNNGTYTLLQGNGSRLVLNQNGNFYTPSISSYPALLKNADGTYSLYYKNGNVSSFDGNGRITAITDRNSNAITFVYDVDGSLSAITGPSGRAVSLSYASGKISSISDPNGNTYAFTYSGDMLIGVTVPTSAGSGNWSYDYDSNAFMLSKTDPAGYTTSYSYDPYHRVTQSTDPEGRIKTVAYPELGADAVRTTTVTEKDGGVWTYKYDTSAGVLKEKTDPDGATTIYTYDGYRNLLAVTDPQGNTTAYAYDIYGNMTSTTDALGSTTAYTYNANNQVTGVTDPQGNTTAYGYDSNWNLISSTDAAGAETQYRYDTKGNIVQITDAAGKATALGYDGSNNLVSITDPAGATTLLSYDSSGNVTSLTDAGGGTTRFAYNSLNQLVKATDPNNKSTAYTYDALGNRATVTDANGNTTVYEYNYRKQLTSIKDALGNVTTYTYGGGGCTSCGGGADKLTAVINAQGNATTYTYDALGRLSSETTPLGKTTSYAYDSSNRLISRTDANGAIVVYSYDADGRLIGKKYPDGSIESFQYDSKGNITYAGNKNIAYNLIYDPMGRLTGVTDSNGRSLTYRYNALGQRTGMTAPDGSVVEYAYDVANRLVGITEGTRTFAFTYDSTGRRTALSYPNGAIASYAYDTLGRLTALTHKTSTGATIATFSYTHDNAGNRLTRTADSITGSYIYDKIYRLTGASYTGSGPTNLKDESFTYDKVGNRLTSTPNRIYTYNAGDELTSYRGKVYSYDNNGSLIRKTDVDLDLELEGWTYYYDYDNRLVKAIKSEKNEVKTITFKYDPFGRRVEKKVEGADKGVTETKTYTYVYDNEDIVSEYDAGGNLTSRYIHGPGIDEPLALETGGVVYYYHADGLGSIVALTDAGGKVAQSYEYDAFGGLHDKMSAVKQPYTFTGREYDRETGLYYYRARYYDVEIGRFISRDPIGFAGGDVNLYGYVLNSPSRFIDPYGLIRWDTVGEGIISVVSGGISVAAGAAAVVTPTIVGQVGGTALVLGGSSAIGFGVSQIIIGVLDNEMPFNSLSEAIIKNSNLSDVNKKTLLGMYEISGMVLDLVLQGKIPPSKIGDAIAYIQYSLSIGKSIDQIKKELTQNNQNGSACQ